MVSLSSIISMLVVLVLSVALPIGALLFINAKYKGERLAAAWGIGALGFFVLQRIIRMPIITILSLKPWYREFATKYYVLYCLILASTAGLFEVIARVITISILKKKRGLSMRRGIAAGMGHGGIECILLLSATYVSNISMAIMINIGSVDALGAYPGIDTTAAAAIETAKQALINTKPILYYLALYERIPSMLFHVALTTTVCFFAMKGKMFIGALIAFALHTFVDGFTAIASGLAGSYLGVTLSQTTVYIIIYAFLTAVGVLSVVFTVKMCRGMKVQQAEVTDEQFAAC